MVTLELLAHTISNPQTQLDALTPAVIQQRAQLMIASSLVTETGEPSGLPLNSHATFASAAEATQGALLAQLALARRPRPPVTITGLDYAQLVAALDPLPRFAALATRRVVRRRRPTRRAGRWATCGSRPATHSRRSTR